MCCQFWGCTVTLTSCCDENVPLGISVLSEWTAPNIYWLTISQSFGHSWALKNFYMVNDGAKNPVVYFWLFYINCLFTLFDSNLSFSQWKMNILKSVSFINVAGGLINLLLQESWETKNFWNCLLPETFFFFSCLPFFEYVAPAFQKRFFKQRKILKILSMCECSPSKLFS